MSDDPAVTTPAAGAEPVPPPAPVPQPPPSPPSRSDRPDQPDAVRYTVWFPAALLFWLLFFVIPLALWVKPRVSFPFLGESLSYLLFMALAFPAAAGLFSLSVKYRLLVGYPFDEFYQYVCSATGAPRRDILLCGFSLVSLAILALLQAWLVVPLAAAAATAFLALAFKADRRLWPVRRYYRPLPDEIPPAPAPPPTDPAVTGKGKTITLRWSFEREFRTSSENQSVDLEARVFIPHEEYAAAKKGNVAAVRSRQPDLSLQQIVSFLARQGGEAPAITSLGQTLVRASFHHELSVTEEIANALALAQSITYLKDIDSTGHDDYWKLPLETIYDEGGDCEDKTFLALALLHQIFQVHHGRGEPLALAFLMSGKDHHAALGVEYRPGNDQAAAEGRWIDHDSRKFFYCETTAEGFRVGQLPDDVHLDSYEVVLLT